MMSGTRPLWWPFVAHFVEEHGLTPTRDSWTAARMSPSERTVRKRFGSFRAAAEAAGGIRSPSGR